IVEPGKEVTVTLSPLYTSDRAGDVKMTAALVLVAPRQNGGPEKSLGSNVAVNVKALPFTTRVNLPDSAAGDYAIEVRLAADGERRQEPAGAASSKRWPCTFKRLRRKQRSCARGSPKLPRKAAPRSLRRNT